MCLVIVPDELKSIIYFILFFLCILDECNKLRISSHRYHRDVFVVPGGAVERYR